MGPRGQRLRVGACLYAGLLVGSHLWRAAYHSAEASIPKGAYQVSLPKFTADGEAPGRARIVFKDSAQQQPGAPVMLIHGSPGDKSVFDGVAAQLPPGLRVLTPDLPGFGDSTRDVPDYSFRAHARYLLALMDRLQARDAQLVGFSMGGGVALSMAALAPERVRSIVMLSAIGLQEYELTGNYWLNHGIHGAQLAGLLALREGTPHFGLFPDTMLTVEYARNFYDSDQRPLRAALEAYRGPMLILHGRQDRLVTAQAAVAHHAMVKQSELVLYDEDHFMTFMKPEVSAPALSRFLLQHVDP